MIDREEREALDRALDRMARKKNRASSGDDAQDEASNSEDASARATTSDGRKSGGGGGVNARMREVHLELAVRFILNAPPEEIEDTNRLFFLVEQAHWYYEDFTREREPGLPTRTFEAFSKELFQNVPALKSKLKNFDDTLKAFKTYKFSIPTCGAVLLNPTMDKCLMVKGWGKFSKSLGFPKGKCDANETEEECAAREVEEEIGVNIRDFIVPEDKVIFYRKRAPGSNFLQKNTLFMIQGISEETKFLTHTRKEIGDIVWNPISIFEHGGNGLKLKYGSVVPVLRSIVDWVKSRKAAQPQPRTNKVVAPQSPAANRATAMTLQELENELLASAADEVEDEPEDEDAGVPYKPFAALENFKFNKSAIMQPFVRG